LENSFFYFGAYKKTHLVLGAEYNMDAAYFGAIFVMFFVQVFEMLKSAFDCIEHTTQLADKNNNESYESFDIVLGGWYHSIEHEGVQLAYLGRLQRSIRRINELGTLTEEPWFEATSTAGVVMRLFGIAFYLSLFPLSYLLIDAVYDNSAGITERISFGVPFIVTVIRICIPTYLVPFFIEFEGWDNHTKFKQTIGRMFALKMFTINQLLFTLHRTTANCGQLRMQYPGDKETICICREIFIGE